jgi:anti-anti-sigma factor
VKLWNLADRPGVRVGAFTKLALFLHMGGTSVDTEDDVDAAEGGTEPTIEVRWPRSEVAVVVLRGEHDLASVGTLAGQLANALATSEHLIVDVSEAAFIDSTTIRAIAAAKNEADLSGRRFNLLVGTAAIVEMALELSGVIPLLNTVHSLDEALAGRCSPPAPGARIDA